MRTERSLRRKIARAAGRDLSQRGATAPDTGLFGRHRHPGRGHRGRRRRHGGLHGLVRRGRGGGQLHAQHDPLVHRLPVQARPRPGRAEQRRGPAAHRRWWLPEGTDAQLPAAGRHLGAHHGLAAPARDHVRRAQGRHAGRHLRRERRHAVERGVPPRAQPGRPDLLRHRQPHGRLRRPRRTSTGCPRCASPTTRATSPSRSRRTRRPSSTTGRSSSSTRRDPGDGAAASARRWGSASSRASTRRSTARSRRWCVSTAAGRRARCRSSACSGAARAGVVGLWLNGQEIDHGVRRRLRAGDSVRFQLMGGGGYGDPLERDAERVEDGRPRRPRVDGGVPAPTTGSSSIPTRTPSIGDASDEARRAARESDHEPSDRIGRDRPIRGSGSPPCSGNPGNRASA